MKKPIIYGSDASASYSLAYVPVLLFAGWLRLLCWDSGVTWSQKFIPTVAAAVSPNESGLNLTFYSKQENVLISRKQL